MVKQLPPETVRERIESDEHGEHDDSFDLVDIRDDDAYEDGHLPGAEHLTVADLEETVAEREWGDEVVVYCYIGETSIQAARLIEEYGDAESVASMDGGYDAWGDADGGADE